MTLWLSTMTTWFRKAVYFRLKPKKTTSVVSHASDGHLQRPAVLELDYPAIDAHKSMITKGCREQACQLVAAQKVA